MRRGLAGLSLQQQYAGAGAHCYHIDKTTNYYNTTLDWSGKEMKIYFFLAEFFLDSLLYMSFYEVIVNSIACLALMNVNHF